MLKHHGATRAQSMAAIKLERTLLGIDLPTLPIRHDFEVAVNGNTKMHMMDRPPGFEDIPILRGESHKL